MPEDPRLEEDAYFRERDRELLEAQRRDVARKSAREAMGSVLEIDDDSILSDLQRLGYDAETVKVLPLLPLIRVAWSEGVVTCRERDAILAAAKSRGIEDWMPAHKKLEFWLEEPPSDPVYKPSLELLGRILREGGAKAPGLQEIIESCTKVAAVSGGFFGLGASVSDIERTVIERIRTTLQAEPAT